MLTLNHLKKFEMLILETTCTNYEKFAERYQNSHAVLAQSANDECV